MKRIFPTRQKTREKSAEQSPRPFVLALMLTGILALEMHPTLTKKATADVQPPITTPTWNHHGSLVKQLVTNLLTETSKPQKNSDPIHQPAISKSTPGGTIVPAHSEKLTLTEIAELPESVSEAVLQKLQGATQVPVNQLQIVEVEEQTWPDTCLGLAQPDELCGQMLVEGWKVVVTDSTGKTWVCHTDATGKVVRWQAQK